MQINISARHGDLGGEAQERIREKVSKLPRFFDRLTAIVVTVDLEHLENIQVEVRASAEHTEDFVATDKASGVLAALDGAVHKIERQLRKHKEKLTGHRQPGLKHLDSAQETEPSSDEDTD